MKINAVRLSALVLALASTGTCLAGTADIAPTGVLRATFLGSNPVQGNVDPKTGEVTGVVADIVKEMARRLGVRYEVQPAANAGDIVKRLNEHSADIGFMAFDAKRGKEVDFSDSYALMYNAFIAKADSPIMNTAQVDRPGVKVAAVKGQTQEIVLSETIKSATMEVLPKKPTPKEVEELLVSGRADVYGANRHDAEHVSADSGGKLKALPDNFLTVEQAVVTPKGEATKMAEVNRLLAAVNSTGYVGDALKRTNISGLAVANGTHR